MLPALCHVRLKVDLHVERRSVLKLFVIKVNALGVQVLNYVEVAHLCSFKQRGRLLFILRLQITPKGLKEFDHFQISIFACNVHKRDILLICIS